MKNDLSDLEESVGMLLEELWATLPTGSARLDRRCGPQSGGTVLTLTPADPRCAVLEVHSQNGVRTITIWAGRSTPIEVLPARTAPSVVDVREVCEAVLTGKFEEELTLTGDSVSKCVGRIEYGGRTHVYHYFGGVFRPFRKKQRLTVKYRSYYGAAIGDHASGALDAPSAAGTAIEE